MIYSPVGFARLRRLPALLALVGLTGAAGVNPASAQSLTKRVEVDFFRDVQSRALKGLATRSDGRLVSGPVFTDLHGTPGAELLWTLTPGADGTWLAGTGPDGKIVEFTLDSAGNTYSARDVVKLEDAQVLALARLPNQDLLAGTSPKGSLFLVRGGEVIARVALPVDSVLDVLVLDERTALVATGNPGRIYKVDPTVLARAGQSEEKVTDTQLLANAGITLFGEIRDRNVRRIARHPDGRILAGSAPRGNLYSFQKSGGAPVILQENRDAEVADIVVSPEGDVYAAVVFASTPSSSRINRPTPPPPPSGEREVAPATPAAAEIGSAERFTGRSAVLWFPATGGLPETIASRNGVAFYRLALRGTQLLIAGGEQGDLLGYDFVQRRSLTFPGSGSSQLNAIAAVDADRFLVLRNNSAGLSLVNFRSSGPREAETRRLDVGAAGQLGALRFGRLRDLDPAQVELELKTNFGSDEIEGWSPWIATAEKEGAWRTDEPTHTRYLKLKLTLPAASPESLELDKATLYYLPQNRRPTLTDFRVFSPDFGMLPVPEPPPQPNTTLAQILGQTKDNTEEKRKNAFLGSAIVPVPGAQIVYWTLSDADGDALAATFSIRRDGDKDWTDLALDTTDSFAQFDTSHLPDGIYFTRLVVKEQAPRPVEQRLTTTIETDDLLVDRTAPEILDLKVERQADAVVVTVTGRDALALVSGAEFIFNNGYKEALSQPDDGIRDGLTETFVLRVPRALVDAATNVEVIVYDANANGTARRVRF